MLPDCKYNKIKVLYDLSRLAWFLQNHGMLNAQEAGDSKCFKEFESLKHDIDKHIKLLDESMKEVLRLED